MEAVDRLLVLKAALEAPPDYGAIIPAGVSGTEAVGRAARKHLGMLVDSLCRDAASGISQYRPETCLPYDHRYVIDRWRFYLNGAEATTIDRFVMAGDVLAGISVKVVQRSEQLDDFCEKLGVRTRVLLTQNRRCCHVVLVPDDAYRQCPHSLDYLHDCGVLIAYMPVGGREFAREIQKRTSQLSH